MRILTFLLIIVLSTKVYCYDSAPAIVAVIDTGLSYSDFTRNAKLCVFGRKNFTDQNEYSIFAGTKSLVPSDNHGHGTNIAGVIQQYAGDANYCMVIIKYFDPKSMNNNNLENTVKAIDYATSIGAKYINYSGGGTAMDLQEIRAVKRFLNKGGIFIAAAGNEKSDVEKQPYYPALDDPRVIAVGSIDSNGMVAKYSNYGKPILRWENGTDVFAFGLRMSGTSQAAAIVTGKMIKSAECQK